MWVEHKVELLFAIFLKTSVSFWNQEFWPNSTRNSDETIFWEVKSIDYCPHFTKKIHTFFTLGCHWPDRYWLRSLLPAVPPSVCPSVHPKRCFFSYSIKISDAQYHGVNCYSKWLCSSNFWVFHGTLKFAMICFFDQVWGKTLAL